jgi:arylsulfatase A
MCFSATAADRPNVLLILADDVGRELLGSYGAEGYSTPNLDQLAASGTRFETCYATPLCSPTRVMLLTGRYSFRNYTQWAHMNPSLVTIAQLMRDAGYATGFAGKWQLGGWKWGEAGARSLVERAGFDEYCSYDAAKMLRDGQAGKGNRFWGGRVYQDGRSFKLQRYGPEVYSDYLVDFMRRHRDEPFFAYYAMTSMHRPFYPTPDHPDAPAPGQAPPKAWLGSRGAPEHFDSMLTYADRMVGKLLDELKALGIDDNTMVIFAADNGTDNKIEAATIRSRFRGREIRGGKYFPTEMGASVPLLIRWPGRVKSGAVSEALVDFTDLAPTICDAAGAPLPTQNGFDGQSLLPLLSGARQSHKSFLYTWGNFEQNSQKYKDPARYRAGLLDIVRDERWKLYSDGRLFDLASDYFEERPAGPGAEADAARRRLEQFREDLQGSGQRLW